MADRLRLPRTARWRSTLAATAIVAVALIAAGFGAVVLQRRSLVAGIDATLTARVDDVTAFILDGAVPADLAVMSENDTLVQIVDGDGMVIASTTNIGGQGPIAEVRLAAGGQVVTTTGLPIGESDFRLVARSLTAHEQVFTVFAASSLEPVHESVATLTAILLAGIPLLIGFVGLTVWLVVGRTLRPVEAIRSEVAAIGDRQLDRRVPVPEVDDEIGRLARTMNQMLERLEAAATQQRSFVSDASHELRSPLAAIRSQLEVSIAHPDSADRSQSDTDALDETLRMQRLVEDLLLLARSDSGTLPVKWEPVDLDDIVFSQTDHIRATTDITIDTTSVSGAQVSADPDGLARVVRNLIENAARYATSRVWVALAETDQIATLTIDDDGPGIPHADQTRVLERFTRLDEARDRGHGGAGLGLAIAKQIAEHHNGTIAISDSTLGGTRVTICLPTNRPAPVG